MKLGYIGLGKMGYNMVLRLREKNWEVAAYNKTPEPTRELKKEGVIAAYALKDLVDQLSPPRVVWLMVPYQVVDEVLSEFTPFLQKGDIIIDGGNSPYKESMRRARELEGKNINFLDVGVSGGPKGARNGACCMIGGKEDIYRKLEKLFKDISADHAYVYLGPSGAGHFVKMVHNGIEYGMMQAIAEGFEIMKVSPFKLNLEHIADVYNHQSVVESRLVAWLKDAFKAYGQDLSEISGSVGQTGEGLWTIDAAKELGVDVPIIEGAVAFRTQSESKPSYTGKVLSAMRNQFGGHNVAT